MLPLRETWIEFLALALAGSCVRCLGSGPVGRSVSLSKNKQTNLPLNPNLLFTHLSGPEGNAALPLASPDEGLITSMAKLCKFDVLELLYVPFPCIPPSGF